MDHLKAVIHRLAHEYGYRYFKLDAFSNALIDNGLDSEGWMAPRVFAYQPPNDKHWCKGHWRKVHNPLMTPYEVHRAGVKAIREKAGKEAYLLGCEPAQSMAVYGSSFGVVDAMRIGMDNCFATYPEDLEYACATILDRKGNQWAHLLHGPIAGSRNYHLNRRIWHNDPDQVCDNLLLLSWVALSDSTWMVSGSFEFGYRPGQSSMADHFQKTIPNHGKPNRPVDLFESPLPRVWIVSDGEGEARRDVVGFFNWNATGEPEAIEETFERLDVPADGLYVAYDFWADQLQGLFKKSVKVDVPPKSCTVLALRAWQKHPMVISTSRHITQGMLDVSEEHWDSSTNTLSGVSQVIGGFPYELRIYAPALLRAEQGWKNVQALSSGVGGDVVPVSVVGDLVRVRLQSSRSGAQHWSVCFEAKSLKEIPGVEVVCSELQPGPIPIADVGYPPDGLEFSRVDYVTEGGYYDVRSRYGDKSHLNGLLYARAQIVVPTAGKGYLRIGADGPYKIFVNGREVGCHATATNPIPDNTLFVPVEWRPGSNEILLALQTNKGAAWGFMRPIARL
jgi:hypothetical protein